MRNEGDVLASWASQEAAVRARHAAGGLQSGVATPEQIAGKSGLEVFDSMFSGELPFAPIGETLDFIAVEIKKGHAVFQGPPPRQVLQPHGFGTWRLVRHTSRFSRGVRNTFFAAAGKGLHHP
jgi:hypothetical protein